MLERADINQQASGANAGSLHVQGLTFDFGENATVGGNRAADTLPLGPASVKLWQQIQRDTGQDMEVKITGGLMVAENERDIAFLRAKIALEKTKGIEAELVGGNDLRRIELALAKRRSPPNGARWKARSIR